MKYRKISLINPPLDEGKIKCVDAGHWQPLNLLTLSSYLTCHGFEGDIQILDQDVHTPEAMAAKLADFKPDLAGLSPNIDTYRQTLAIAGMLKRSGADIVLGGSYATESAVNIMKNRRDIDYVIAKDGEKALMALVRGDKEEGIPNLVYRKNGKIHSNRIELASRATFSEINYTDLIDMTAYFKNYEKSLNPGPYKRPVAILSQRGCVWREKTGGCIFCSRIEPHARFDNPGEIWQRISKMKHLFGIDSIMDVGDDFLGSMKWFNAFHGERPDELKDIGVRFIYSRANNIDRESVKKLRDLNTFEICLGLESGDKGILIGITKGNTPSQQLHAVKRLADNHINVMASFILGLPGESKTSVLNTMEQVKRIRQFPNITEIIISVMTPLPGSPAFQMLLGKNHVMKEKYVHADMFDLSELQKDWVTHFCSVDYDTVLQEAHGMDHDDKNIFIEFSEGGKK